MTKFPKWGDLPPDAKLTLLPDNPPQHVYPPIKLEGMGDMEFTVCENQPAPDPQQGRVFRTVQTTDKRVVHGTIHFSQKVMDKLEEIAGGPIPDQIITLKEPKP